MVEKERHARGLYGCAREECLEDLGASYREGSGLSLHSGGGPTGDYCSEGSIEGTRYVSHCPGEQRNMIVLNVDGSRSMWFKV